MNFNFIDKKSKGAYLKSFARVLFRNYRLAQQHNFFGDHRTVFRFNRKGIQAIA